MKKLLLLLLVFVSVITGLNAQEARSILKIRLSNGDPLTIEIDGRRFNKVNTKLTVGDLPKGKHNLKVYRFIPNSNSKGGQAKLLFEGTVKIAPYTMAYAIVDARSGRMKFYDHEIGTTVAEDDQEFDDQAGTTETANNTNDRSDRRDNNDSYNRRDQLSDKEIANLKTLVDDRITDSDRLKLLQNELGKKYYSTEQVRTMMRWLSFESSKLDFAKWAFNHVTDKNNYKMLETEFSFSSSKDEFNNYINGK